MNKTLRFSLLSMLLMLCGSMFAADDVTISADKLSGLPEGPVTVSGYTFTADKAEGKTAPAYNTNGNDVRLYALNTLNIKSASGNMTKITFNLSAQGKKRLAPITASVGTIAKQNSADETVVWTGNASEVTFTVGEKATYGTDGEDKAGQFDFSSVVFGEGGDTPGPGPDPGVQTVANIAAFKALAAKTEAELTLKDAEVLYVNGTNDIYVRDASGAIDFYKTGLELTAGQKLNGSVIGIYDTYNNTPELTKSENTNASKITVSSGTVTAKNISAADAANYICDLVKISGATVTENGGNYYVGDVQIYDKFKVMTGTPEAGKTYDIEGIVIMYKEVVEICPIKDYTDGSDPGPGPDIQTVANIAAFKALANNTEATLTLKDAEVLYVNGTNDMYVRDASGAIDFFRTGLTYTAGQKLNGSVTGKYSLYQNTPELAKTDNTNGDKITATDGTVTAKSITAAEVKNNICDLVKLTGVTVTENEGKYYIDDVQIYDKFKVMTGTPEVGKTYDIEGIAIMFNDVVELCPISDYTAGSGPAELVISGAATFEESTVVTITPSDVDHDVYYTLDGSDPKTSSTNKRYMEPFTITESCTVKAWEEDADLYAEMTFTKSAPQELTVEDVIAANPENTNSTDGQVKVWVTGYIVGYIEGAKIEEGAKFQAEGCETKTNLLLATNYAENNVANCIPVQLPNNNVRTDLNLQDHPENLGKEVKLYGHVLKYFSVPGLKNVTAYEFTGNTSVDMINAETISDGKMYNVAGQRVDASYKGIVIMNGKKYMMK